MNVEQLKQEAVRNDHSLGNVKKYFEARNIEETRLWLGWGNIEYLLALHEYFKELNEEETEVTVEPKKFYATCVKDCTMEDPNGQILHKVLKGEEFKVTLDEESDQYFTTDSNQRKVYVGYRDVNGVVHIDDSFRLMAISQNESFEYVYGNVDIMRRL